MCGYDPFRWADIYQNEADYWQEVGENDNKSGRIQEETGEEKGGNI